MLASYTKDQTRFTNLVRLMKQQNDKCTEGQALYKRHSGLAAAHLYVFSSLSCMHVQKRKAHANQPTKHVEVVTNNNFQGKIINFKFSSI